jgi:hypothetical protein
MGGYAVRSGVARGSLDPLQCRVAVVGAGDASLVLVALDLLQVSGPWARELRDRIAAALETEMTRVLVAATHTHSGPAVFGLGGSARLSAYESKVAEIAVRTADAARENAEPVELFAGESEAEGVGSSRRDVREPVDAKVRTLTARRANGSTAGVIAAFGCHPTVLPASSLDYSRDLFGGAVDVATAEIGAPVVLFNGAAADVSTRFTRVEATAAEAARLGGLLGSALAASTRNARPVDGDHVAARSRRVPIRLRSLPSEAEAEERMEEAAAAVEGERARRAESAAMRLAVSRLEGAMAQLYFARQGGWESLFGHVPDEAEVQDLRIGGFHVLAAPGEVFSSVGHRVCTGRSALLVGYANDYLGYLVPPERAGDGEYEALMAALEPQSAAAIEAALLGLVADA